VKTIVSTSGGMDSAAVIAWALDEGRDVFPVHFQYGAKNNKWERQAMLDVLAHFGLRQHLRHYDISACFTSFKSNLLDGQGEIPEGHFLEPAMTKTYLPARNIVFAAILAGLAQSMEVDTIAFGFHQTPGDITVYPDTTPAFFEAMKLAVEEGTGRATTLEAPFVYTNKKGILMDGIAREVPYELTRTCYKDQRLPCGKCGACRKRLDAFESLGLKDPVKYEEAD